MYLYLVTCVGSRTLGETLDVFIVASNTAKASELALDLMRKLKYKYVTYVDNVKILASVNTLSANSLLVVDNGQLD